ncbi:hypothetical protein M9Y10_013462 [Tritrichomonas musculus]|uniref:Uncharacterized protein n=1 Tax=Tritrichomonas musculus TaxID=1915356 RepID=A0ABR2I777_9EUKA
MSNSDNSNSNNNSNSTEQIQEYEKEYEEEDEEEEVWYLPDTEENRNYFKEEEDIDDDDEAFQEDLPEFEPYEELPPYISPQTGEEFKTKKIKTDADKLSWINSKRLWELLSERQKRQ